MIIREIIKIIVIPAAVSLGLTYVTFNLFEEKKQFSEDPNDLAIEYGHVIERVRDLLIRGRDPDVLDVISSVERDPKLLHVASEQDITFITATILEKALNESHQCASPSTEEEFCKGNLLDNALLQDFDDANQLYMDAIFWGKDARNRYIRNMIKLKQIDRELFYNIKDAHSGGSHFISFWSQANLKVFLIIINIYYTIWFGNSKFRKVISKFVDIMSVFGIQSGHSQDN